MKLSSKGRYAIRALFDIAFFSAGAPTQVKDIATRESIPPRFLEQIFQDLKRAGIVGSKRGPQGGYHLSRPPNEIALGDVIRALEGPIALGDRGDSAARRRAGHETRRVTDSVLAELSAKVTECFDSISVADICARAEALGLRSPAAERYVYVI